MTRVFVPILHPAYILRGKWGLEPAQVVALQTLRELASNPGYVPPNVREPPPGALTDPTIPELEDWCAGVDDSGVAVDVETAGEFLVCVGMCRLRDYRSIVFRFRRQGGSTYWRRDADLRRCVELCFDLLAAPKIPLVFHNGQNFDIPYLRRVGFLVNGYAFDTMLAHFLAYPEMPKGLAFLAGLYLQIPSWKFLATPEMEGEGKN